MNVNLNTVKHLGNYSYSKNLAAQPKSKIMQNDSVSFGKKAKGNNVENSKEKKKSHAGRNIAIVLGGITAFCVYAMKSAAGVHKSFGNIYFG